MRYVTAAAFAFLVLGPATAAAQGTGTIRGTVTDQESGRGIEAVQVFIQGTALGAITNASGAFLLTRVPAGEVTVRAIRIGVKPGQQTVTVTADATSEVKIALSRSALSLDEVVVTGQAGATEKRKLGNSLTTVNASELLKEAPAANLTELVQGRAAGVNVLPSGGTVGTGANIRIRGLTSVSQDGGPAIYIDGVRVDASTNAPNVGGLSTSRLLDLIPSDIDRIEIVKGAAASTLYGTQGSNGVVQIFTKKGSAGAPRWSFETEQGIERLDAGRMPGRLWTEFTGPTGYRAHDPREIIKNGYQQKYAGSVSGGLEAVNYYLSGSFQRQEGSVVPISNWMRQGSGRANLNAVLNSKLSLGVNVGYVASVLRIPDNDNALHGIYSQVVSGVPWTADSSRRWGERWGSYDINQTIENYQDIQRFTGGFNVEHRPLDFLTNRLILGLDWIDEENTRYVPYGFKGSGIPFGSRSNQRRAVNDVTVDLRSLLSNRFGSSLTSEFALGMQADIKSDNRTLADGRDFPAPGVTTVSSTAIRTAAETRLEEINAGVFFQETVGFQDKLFLSGGVRVDGNSAFGDDFPLQSYPKASVAYNISQESFWPKNLVPTMKLRVAWGTSGLSPAQFSADQTYIAIAAEQGKAAVSPNNVGDPNLGPEKSQELELGVDAGLWKDRLGLEFTYYTQRTVDALVQKQFPPSSGFLNRQFANIGEVRNHGFEAGLRTLLLTGDRFEWDANFQLAYQHNEVTDLGGSPPISNGPTRITEGYPILGIWTRGMKGWDPVLRTHIATDTLIYRGSAAPDYRGSVTMRFKLFQRFTVSGLADFARGMYEQNFAKGWSISKLTGDDYLALTVRPRGTPTPAADSLLNLISVLGPGYFVEKGDFVKLREVSLGYQLPAFSLRGRQLRQAYVRLAGRNLWTHAPNYGNPDPEVNTNGNSNFARGSDFNTQPPARRFTVSFSTSF